MKKILILIICLFSGIAFGQNDVLAKEYFDKGQFEQAVLAYEELYKTNKSLVYFNNLLISYQELKQFSKAEKLILERQQHTRQPGLLVELGYNYQLQNKAEKAEEAYKKAKEAVKDNPHLGGNVAHIYEQKSLLNKALETYNLASSLNENLNYEYQKGRIYGQLGDLEMMIDSFLEYAYKNKNVTLPIQNQFYRFMSEDSSDSFADMLRRSLLIKAQNTQDIYWNEFLSWFFVQQKQYDRAFAQEKAIYRRNQEGLSGVLNLAQLTIEQEDYELSDEIFRFILEHSQDKEIHIQVRTLLTEMRIKTSQPKEYSQVTKEIEKLLEEFGKNPSTIELQLLQARFVGFNLDNPQEAEQILDDLLKLNVNNFIKAEIKMELADMLLYQEKFNQALIYYSQIENDLKNHEIGHEANLKIAQASYYKGDFEWALRQLSVLKSSSSQLIANDALDLYLLINDVKADDSTYTALKKFAKADFLVYKQKNEQALKLFYEILKEHKGQEIEAVTLFRTGQLLEIKANYLDALSYYQAIIDHFSDGIYLDEALFFSAEIYHKYLDKPEKAKELYELLIFNHQDSIYFVDARNQYRILRGDSV